METAHLDPKETRVLARYERCLARFINAWGSQRRLHPSGCHQASHGPIQTLQGLRHIGRTHRRTEPVMARRSAVVVEIDAFLNRQGDETQHPFPLVANGIPIAAYGFRNAEVDAEARAEPLDMSRDAMALEEVVEAAVEVDRKSVV